MLYIYTCRERERERERKTVGWERLDRDLFKRIGTIKGTFHARMGTIKDRSGKDLTDAED